MNLPPKNKFAATTGLALLSLGMLLLVLVTVGVPLFAFAGLTGILLVISGSLISIVSKRQPVNPSSQLNGTWFKALTSRKAAAWLLSFILTGFYILIYWFPESLQNLTKSIDPLSFWLRNMPADHWFLYGLFYTLSILLMGVYFLLKYRHSRYHIIRTFSVMFFQFGFAFILPALLLLFKQPEFYFSYFWPLKYDYLFPATVKTITENGAAAGVFMIFWGAVLSFFATPILTFFFGKRWYCSWVCGCGGLAETAGDPFRHLSDKRRVAWQWEVAIIYTILGFVIITTALLWLNSWKQGAILGRFSAGFSQAYGFYIGAIFSGVVGVGFYPLMGSRVWCRFGCPMAAYLGILQKHLSRFRITTNGGQCISCGNCSTYCEMGIDVRWYAQQGKPIIRASCVGCGICATVCPRGVLKLENGPQQNRYSGTPLIHPDDVKILS